MAVRALVLAALVACAAAQAAPKAPATTTAAPKPAVSGSAATATAPVVAARGATVSFPVPASLAGRFCHHSCYVGVNCAAAIAAKTKNLQLSKVPFKVEATACNVNGCDAIMLQSYPTKADWSKFQDLEDVDPVLSANYKAAGLKSSTPAGLEKRGECAGFKTFTAIKA